MQATRTPLPLRNDTLLGVCQALGEDFGINPQLLRIAFALAMVLHPANVVLAYLALGVVVLLSRLVFPSRAVSAAQPEPLQVPVSDDQRLPEYAEAA